MQRNEKSEFSILKMIWNFAGVFCLLIAFFGTFCYMKEKGLISGKNSGAKEQVSQETNMKGTYCTLKSNSLDGVPIYPQPDATSQIGFFPEGKCCQILKTQKVEGKKWAQVSYCGLTGWLKMKKIHYISDEDWFIKEGTTVFVNALSEKGINGYLEPSVSSEIVEKGIKYGTEYVVLQLKDGWGQVQKVDGTRFWINMYHIGSYPGTRWTVETLSASREINLRQKPGEKERVLGKIPEDTRLDIFQYQNGWGKIQYNGQEGWVMLHYLTPVADETIDNYKKK